MARLAGDKPYYEMALLDQKGKPTNTRFKLPSVTEVLSVVAKPALQQWYYNKGLEGVGKLLAKYGSKLPMDTPSIKSLMTTEKLGPTHIRDAKGKTGTIVHEDLEKLCRGEQVTGTPENAMLTDWFDTLEADAVIASEQVLVSFRYGIAGTLDLVYRDPGGRVVLADLKTGDSIYWEAFVQVEAYRMIWKEMGMKPDIDLTAVVHCPASGVGGWNVYRAPEVTEEAFLAALTLYRMVPKRSWRPEVTE